MSEKISLDSSEKTFNLHCLGLCDYQLRCNPFVDA